MAFRILLGTILPVLLYAMVAAPLRWMDSSDRDLGGLLYMFGVIIGLGCLIMGHHHGMCARVGRHAV